MEKQKVIWKGKTSVFDTGSKRRSRAPSVESVEFHKDDLPQKEKPVSPYHAIWLRLHTEAYCVLPDNQAHALARYARENTDRKARTARHEPGRLRVWLEPEK